MKKLLNNTLAVMLILSLLSVFSVCMAAADKQHLDYGSYVLLGDSIASGWSDIEDRETRFVRVEGSYGAFLADDLGVTYHPMACIGFRTTELRYIFEDDFEGDRFLFYSISKDEVDRRIPEIRKAVSEAGLITLNVGGNDWGSFIGWHVLEEMEKFEDVNEEFLTKARTYLEKCGAEADTVNNLIDIATTAGCLPRFLKVIPKALNEGLKNYFTNWNILIEDIYALNPDVTLVVVGMFDTALQDESMSSIESSDGFDIQNLATKIEIGQAIVDFANKPMLESAEKYGYIFVEPIGTLCEKQHPSTAGHRHIADLILEALPHAAFPYTDVKTSDKGYKAIEYMWLNGFMDPETETTFAPEANLTKTQLGEVLAKIHGAENVIDGNSDATRFDFSSAALKTAFSGKTDFAYKIKALGFSFRTLVNGGKFNFNSNITRAEAAAMFCDYINL